MLIVDLNGRWSLKEFTTTEEALKLASSDRPTDEWMEATVPGVVHLDLMRAGRIPDPFFRTNEKEVAWVEDRVWVYRREFDVDEAVLGREAIEIVFDGLDTFATIWLNGECLARTQDMFVEHRFNVKPFLRRGVNTILVGFESAKKFLERKRSESPEKLMGPFYPPIAYGRKAQYSFGWDWGPRLPATGIWRGVRLEAYDVSRIDDVCVRTDILQDVAEIRATFTLWAARDSECELSASCSGSEETRTTKIILAKGENKVDLEFSVKHPNLWWPAGYGEQALYSLEVSLTHHGIELDKRTTRFGVRRIELLQQPDKEGKTFIVQVNGIPIFCKGSNWVPADSFLPRVVRESYDRLLTYAREANMNMLRVWGGGIYEDDSFYDLCDEKGIMIWQDFMFACSEYPEDEEFLMTVKDEAEKVVKRLRNHPCITIWCGNNENDWGFADRWWGKRDRFRGRAIYHSLIPGVCARLSPDVPYWPSSPYGGDHPNSQAEGDRHSWDVWSNFKDYTEYRRDLGRFVSEFGFQSMPTPETIREFTLPEDRRPQSEAIEHHNKQVMGNERLYFFLSAHFRVPCDLEDLARLTQVNQGKAMRTGIEHWRSRKFLTAGTLIWQLNDCWPVSSWSLVDFGNRKKASYYYVKRAFAPLVIVMKRDVEIVRVSLVNDELRRIDGKLIVRGLKFTGRELSAQSYDISIEPNASKEVASIPLVDLGISDESREFVLAELISEGRTVARATCLLKDPKHLVLPHQVPRISVRPGGEDGRSFLVTILSRTFIACAQLDLLRSDVECEDNYFDVVPNTPVTLEVRTKRRFKVKDLRRRLRLRDLTSQARA